MKEIQLRLGPVTQSQTTSASNSTVVDLKGSLVLRTAKSVHEVVVTAFKEHRDVEISISDTSEVDLSFIQIIEAVRRSAAESGGEVRLTAPAEGALADALALGGFLNPDDQDRLEFWTHARTAQ